MDTVLASIAEWIGAHDAHLRDSELTSRLSKHQPRIGQCMREELGQADDMLTEEQRKRLPPHLAVPDEEERERRVVLRVGSPCDSLFLVAQSYKVFCMSPLRTYESIPFWCMMTSSARQNFAIGRTA